MARSMASWTRYVLMALILSFLIVCAWSNMQNTEIGLLSERSRDEFAFFGIIDRMTVGLLDFDIRKFFGIVFVNYGFPYFFLMWALTLPFHLSEQYDAVIFIMRMVSALFAAGTAVLVFHLVRRTTGSAVLGLGAVLLIVAQPGIWMMATQVHPDHMMVFWLVATLLFLSTRSVPSDWKTLLISATLFTMAASSKTQAVIHFPGVAVLLLWDQLAEAANGRLSISRAFREAARRLAWFGAFCAGLYLLFNPYMVHPEGIAWFIHFTNQNMLSNATNHFTYVIPSLQDKLDAIFNAFMPLWFTVPATLLAAASVAKFWHTFSDRRPVILALFFSAAPAFAYTLFGVNKDWYQYYITVFMLLPPMLMLAIPTDRRMPSVALCALPVFLIAGVLGAGWKAPDAVTGIIKNDAPLIQRSLALEKAIDRLPAPKGRILLSAYTMFRFDNLGYHPQQVRQITGPLTPALVQQADILVLRKNDVYFDRDILALDSPRGATTRAGRVYIDLIRAGRDPSFKPCGETIAVFLYCRKPPA